MFRSLQHAVIAGFCMGAGICATYPLPQDYSGCDTHSIVTNIRCEARSAVQDALIFALSRYKGQVVFRTQDGRLLEGPEAAAELQNDRTRIREVNLDKDIVGNAKGPFNYYKKVRLRMILVSRHWRKILRALMLGCLGSLDVAATAWVSMEHLPEPEI